MKQKNILLAIGLALVTIGLIKPDFNNLFTKESSVSNVIVKPSDKDLINKGLEVSKAVSNLSSYEAKRLSDLYNDISLLIVLDGEDEIIKSTEDIRQANSIAGNLLKMNIKGKCPELAEKAGDLITSAIGDDNVQLDKDLRAKAAEAFKALAWACDKGSK